MVMNDEMGRGMPYGVRALDSTRGAILSGFGAGDGKNGAGGLCRRAINGPEWLGCGSILFRV